MAVSTLHADNIINHDHYASVTNLPVWLMDKVNATETEVEEPHTVAS